MSASTPRIDTIENRLIVGRKVVEIIGSISLGSAIIPSDNTIPQISEGNEVFNFNYTPKKIGNKVSITSVIHINQTNSANNLIILFIDGASDAVTGGANTTDTANRWYPYELYYELIAASLSPINFQIRTGTSGTISLNNSAGVTWGNIVKSWAVVEETETPPV